MRVLENTSKEANSTYSTEL